MFLTDKYHSLLPFHPNPPPRRLGSSRFDAALAARLRSLLPLAPSPLACLSRLADLLAVTLADAAAAVPSLAGGDAAAVAAHLDAGVALLDSCNAIASHLDRLRRRRLLSRLALYLLSSTASSPGRARAAIADRDGDGHHTSPSPLPILTFSPPPRGSLSAVRRVLLAVDAVSALASAAAAAVLGGAAEKTLPRVAREFPWAEAFNALAGELSLHLAGAGEVDAVEEAVRRLAAVLDGEGNGDEEALRDAVREVDKLTEELTAGLDRLSNAVNGVFRSALGLRNAELSSFQVGPTKQECK